MSDTKVITQEELKSIEDLRKQSTDLIFEFGQVEMEIHVTETRLNELKSHKEKLQFRYKELQSKETEIVQTLNEKYGAGTLNIENGEFIAS